MIEGLRRDRYQAPLRMIKIAALDISLGHYVEVVPRVFRWDLSVLYLICGKGRRYKGSRL